jgi:hypothetical protein
MIPPIQIRAPDKGYKRRLLAWTVNGSTLALSVNTNNMSLCAPQLVLTLSS